MFRHSNTIAVADSEVWKFIQAEADRQEQHIELIASENYTSPAVMQAQGSLLTNKYAEGYPGKRYYGGCQYVDEVERIAIERARKLFCEPAGVEMAVNVQPHSGAQANEAVLFGLLNPGDIVMGMSLADGGHLTHGMHLNFSGRYFNIVSYGVRDDTEAIDYDEVERLAKEHQPKLIIAGASAYSLHIDFKRFADIAHSVGAILMTDIAHYAGLVAAGVYPSPFGYADVVTTTTHKTLRGPRGGMILCKSEFAEAVDKGCPLVIGGPLPHVMAAKAVALEEAEKPEFSDYARRIVDNARHLAAACIKEGIPVATGGTDNHLMLLDVRPFGLNGRQAESLLRECGITLNRNALPFDPNGPWYTSGLRIGTPALTTLGMGGKEMEEVASIIALVLRSAHPVRLSKGEHQGELSKNRAKAPDEVMEEARGRVEALLGRFVLYPELDLELLEKAFPLQEG